MPCCCRSGPTYRRSSTAGLDSCRLSTHETGRLRYFTQEVGGQSPLEGSPEEHGGAGVLLLPAIEVAMAISPRAGQVLADLGIAVGHGVTSGWATLAGKGPESLSHWLTGAKPSRLSREVPFTTTWLILTTPRRPTRFLSSISSCPSSSVS